MNKFAIDKIEKRHLFLWKQDINETTGKHNIKQKDRKFPHI